MSIAFQEAVPLSLDDIERSSWRFRRLVGADADPWLDVPRILEHGLPLLLGEHAHFLIVESAVLGDNHALADPETGTIWVRADVYHGACTNKGRDRMTVMHEIAHLVLHDSARLARRPSVTRPPAYRDPEWQAKAWAGSVLVPRPFVPDPLRVDAAWVARKFDVSLDAAAYRLEQLRRPFRTK